MYARRVCLTRYPNGAAKLADELKISREGDTLIFYSAAERLEFNRRVKGLYN